MSGVGFTELKNRIALLAIAAAVIFELASVPLLGLRIQFAYGLALGTAVAIMNFTIMAFFVKKSYEKGMVMGYTFGGYLIRLALYGIAILVSAKTSNLSTLGTVLGFLTIQLGIYADSFLFSKKKANGNETEII